MLMMVKSDSSLCMSSNYDSHSSIQMKANERHIAELVEALRQMDRPGEVLTVADFGSATGLNSMKAFTAAFRIFRENSESELLMYHTDLPNNHWSVLFNNALSSPHSYLSLPKTYVAGIGRTYYERLFPEKSISLMHAANTLHWLSTQSTMQRQLQKYVEGDTDLHNELRAIAETDFSRFLSHRFEELKPRGRLVLSMHTSLFKRECRYQSLLRMQTEGLISPKPLQSGSIFVYPVTAAYVTSTISQYPSLRLISLEEHSFLDDYYQQYLLDGDREKFAAHRTDMSRAVNESIIKDLLREEENGGRDLLQVYYEYLRDYLREHPFPLELSELDVVVEKTS